jgi:DNA polymerase-1
MARYLYGYPYTKFQYIRTKAVNFGIPYGRTAPSIALEHNIPIPEAQRMIDDWFKRAPGAYKYIMSCRQAPVQGKALVTPFGRKRRFGLVTPETLHDLQNEASNFPISSTASDCTLHSGMRTDRKLEAMDCKVVNLVHDSIIIEAPYDRSVVEDAIGYMSETMTQVPREFIGGLVPFAADAKVGFAWGAMHPWDDPSDEDNLNHELPPLELYHVPQEKELAWVA